MAKIIEICGSPGVGKSTIFREIEKRNASASNWMTASNKQPMGEQSPIEFLKKTFNEVMKGRQPVHSRSKSLESWFGFLRRIYRGVKLGRNFVDLYILKSAGERFIARYPQYVDACWKNIYYRQAKSSNGLDLRFEKAEFIYLIIKKFQYLKEKKSDKPVIIDEGLINMIDRGLYKSETPEEEEREIKQLLETMPWPDAIVYLDTDLEENAKRIKTRKDIRDMHKGLTTEELMAFTDACRKRILTAISFLENKGIPVLYLDSTNSVKENAGRIIGFTEKLQQGDILVKPKETAISS